MIEYNRFNQITVASIHTDVSLKSLDTHAEVFLLNASDHRHIIGEMGMVMEFGVRLYGANKITTTIDAIYKFDRIIDQLEDWPIKVLYREVDNRRVPILFVEDMYRVDSPP